MADDNQNRNNQPNQPDRSDMANQGTNQNKNQDMGRENDLKNPDQAFDNPQDGGAWDNYRTRSFSSNPESEQTSSGTGNMGNTGPDRSSDENR